MKEYIEKDKPFSLLKNYLNKPNGQYSAQEVVYLVDDLISDIPAADVVEVRHGEWWYRPNLIKTKAKKWPVAECDKCGMTFCDVINCMSEMYHYCPNCGAKMDGGADDGT